MFCGFFSFAHLKHLYRFTTEYNSFELIAKETWFFLKSRISVIYI